MLADKIFNFKKEIFIGETSGLNERIPIKFIIILSFHFLGIKNL